MSIGKDTVGEATNYNLDQMERGKLTGKHITALVDFYQSFQKTNVKTSADGKFGPVTKAALEGNYADLWLEPAPAKPVEPGKFLANPLPLLPGRMTPQARKAVITSSFRPADRKDHEGCDFFYRWETGDEPKFVGDGGCAGKDLNGNPKWVVPYNTYAIAAADGVVQLAGPSPTGYRMWIDHGNGYRSGYFHLESLVYKSGSPVKRGMPIGLIGHNPKDNDARHLHFEVSPVEKYEPLDPERYLIK